MSGMRKHCTPNFIFKTDCNTVMGLMLVVVVAVVLAGNWPCRLTER